jgi:hypothetical protein
MESLSCRQTREPLQRGVGSRVKVASSGGREAELLVPQAFKDGVSETGTCFLTVLWLVFGLPGDAS